LTPSGHISDGFAPTYAFVLIAIRQFFESPISSKAAAAQSRFESWHRRQQRRPSEVVAVCST